MSPSKKQSQLSRLETERYQGDAIVHWSMTMDQRATGWLNPDFHSQFREILLHACSRYQLLAPGYCLMPDHLHLLLAGTTPNSDQFRAIRFVRKHINQSLPSKFSLQKQAHDHLLKPEERERGAFDSLLHYLRANPERASLIPEGSASEWPYTGIIVPGYPVWDPFAEGFSEEYWKIHHLISEFD